MADFASIPGRERFQPSDFKRLLALVRAQCPEDEGQVRLHLERACRAVADGMISVPDLLEAVEACAS